MPIQTNKAKWCPLAQRHTLPFIEMAVITRKEVLEGQAAVRSFQVWDSKQRASPEIKVAMTAIGML